MTHLPLHVSSSKVNELHALANYGQTNVLFVCWPVSLLGTRCVTHNDRRVVEWSVHVGGQGGQAWLVPCVLRRGGDQHRGSQARAAASGLLAAGGQYYPTSLYSVTLIRRRVIPTNAVHLCVACVSCVRVRACVRVIVPCVRLRCCVAKCERVFCPVDAGDGGLWSGSHANDHSDRPAPPTTCVYTAGVAPKRAASAQGDQKGARISNTPLPSPIESRRLTLTCGE
jgi:hypothetical protein